jgi:hypothetical protein
MTASLRALCVTLAAAGCGTQPSPPGAQRDEPPPRHVALDAGTGSNAPVPPALPADPTLALVAAAFGGAAPAFPLLSRDGREAMIGVASSVGHSAVSTYRVSRFSGWTAASDAWGSNASDQTIVDPAMAQMLLDRAMGEPAPEPDPRTLAARAAPVARRLRDGGFTPFERGVAFADAALLLGPVQLRAEHDATGGLLLYLLAPSGTELARQTIAAHPTDLVGDVACLASPAPGRVWLDTARKRVLVEVDWSANDPACRLPDREYGLWPTP